MKSSPVTAGVGAPLKSRGTGCSKALRLGWLPPYHSLVWQAPSASSALETLQPISESFLGDSDCSPLLPVWYKRGRRDFCHVLRVSFGDSQRLPKLWFARIILLTSGRKIFRRKMGTRLFLHLWRMQMGALVQAVVTGGSSVGT